jgi:predicted nucleotidyltransferase
MILLPESYEVFLKAMNQTGVRYLVVGGFAVIAHGVDRTTGDMDVWVDNSEENANALKNALLAINYSPEDVEAAISYFKNAGKLSIYLDEGVPIDLMPKYSTFISFEEAFSRKSIFDFGGIPVNFVDLDTLIALKIRSGREKDLWDVKHLQERKKD